MKAIDKVLLFLLFVLSRSWLAIFSNNPVGVDAWDYLIYIDQSVETNQLKHAPLHVPGFYAVLSLIAVYTGIDTMILYTIVLPLVGSIGLWLAFRSILTDNYWSLLIASLFGFFVIRTSMIIPEWLGLIIIPSVILSLSLMDHKNDFQNRSYIVIYAILCATIIFIHHLSGGIILFVAFSYSLINKDKLLIFVNFILALVALIAWSIAGSFPLHLLYLLIQISFPLIISIFILIVIMFKIDLPQNKISISLRLGIFISILLVFFSLFLAILGGLDLVTILYWSPSMVILPLSLYGFKKVDNEKLIKPKLQFIWIGSILFLIVLFSLFEVIRPLIARILVFEIQALIPVAGLGLAVVIEESYKNSKQKLSLIIAILLLCSFHSYPQDYAWFRTEFRYYNEEVEIAAITGKWLPDNIQLDTDNRLGVMYKGVSKRESSYGEYGESWIANLLAVDSSEWNKIEIPSKFAVLINFVIIETGFMTGKFIHGEGGGASDVSLKFNPLLLKYFTYSYSKPVISGQGSLWVKY